MTTIPEKATTETVDTVQEVTDRTRELGEQATGASRELGKLVLDSYENAVGAFVELEQRTAEVMPVDWMKTAISAHASFIKETNGVYVRAMHSVFG